MKAQGAIRQPITHCRPGIERSTYRSEARDAHLDSGLDGITDAIGRHGVDDHERSFLTQSPQCERLVEGRHDQLVRASRDRRPGRHLEAMAVGIRLDEEAELRVVRDRAAEDAGIVDEGRQVDLDPGRMGHGRWISAVHEVIGHGSFYRPLLRNLTLKEAIFDNR